MHMLALLAHRHGVKTSIILYWPVPPRGPLRKELVYLVLTGQSNDGAYTSCFIQCALAPNGTVHTRWAFQSQAERAELKLQVVEEPKRSAVLGSLM